MSEEIEWSADVAQAEWIRQWLGPFASGKATSVVPAGFPVYARLLHPAYDCDEERAVRWAEVAARNGLDLGPGTGFAEIALRPASEQGPRFPELRGPEEGTLSAGDARVLAEILRRHTPSPEDCWFGLWEGYGWVEDVLPEFLSAPTPDADPGSIATSAAGSRAVSADAAGAGPEETPEVARPGVAPGWSPMGAGERRRGPRVALPHREYVLYHGDLESALAFVESERQTPNLWWPADRTWCVATEIYGWWTYIGGPEDLVREVLTDNRVEAWRADQGDPERITLPSWVEAAIDDAVEHVMAGDQGSVVTSLGTLTATMRRPKSGGHGDLWTTRTGPGGSPGGSGWSSLPDRDDDRLRDQIGHSLRWELIDNLL